ATLLASDPPVLPEFPRDHRTFDGIPPRLTYFTILAIRGAQLRQESIGELSEIDDTIKPPQIRRYRRVDDPEDVAQTERSHLAITRNQQLRTSADKLWMTYRMRIEALGVSVYMDDF